jgi:hypothetical protein
MNIEKIDKDLYYYTDILTQEEQEIVMKTIKEDSNWNRVYDFGDTYNPDRDPDAESSQSCMIAYRKNFNGPEYSQFISIIDKGFQLTTKHYREDKGIQGGRNFPPFKDFAHVDKHLQGTTYATHIDTAPVDFESYTVLFYINDDYVGGELSFSSPESNGEITVNNGILNYGSLQAPKGTYPPDHEKNAGVISHWMKTKPCSIIIFPPLKPYPHTAHEIKEGTKYMIKGFWQVTDENSTKWSSNPYEGLSDEEIKSHNPEGFIYNGEQHSLMLKGIDIIPDEYKNLKI